MLLNQKYMTTDDIDKRVSKPGLVVVIATSGGSSGLESTLASLARCELPDSYVKTMIVENGGRRGAEQIVARFQESLNAEYLFAPRANKSAAINHCLEFFESNQLIYFSDDDIKFDSQVLSRIWAAAKNEESKVVFGGALKVNSNGSPPKHLQSRLPLSMVGFPRPGKAFTPNEGMFLGANWAAFSDDLIKMGGFDPRFGPGSPLRATGQESEMMMMMRGDGFRFQFVEDAIVWHEVEADRFTEDFLSDRRFRGGVQRGLHTKIAVQSNQSSLDRRQWVIFRLKSIVYPWLSTLSKFAMLKETGARLRFSADFARGFFVGYQSKTADEPQPEWGSPKHRQEGDEEQVTSQKSDLNESKENG